MDVTRPELSMETVMQISCNNPHIDRAVAARFGLEPTSTVLGELVLTKAGEEIHADQHDEVPYACPLTQDLDLERTPQQFIDVCKDCPHAYIMLMHE